jgi:hypothetical protein
MKPPTEEATPTNKEAVARPMVGSHMRVPYRFPKVKRLVNESWGHFVFSWLDDWFYMKEVFTAERMIRMPFLEWE